MTEADALLIWDVTIPRETIALLPRGLARKHLVIPTSASDRRIEVAMVDPSNLEAIDDVAFCTGLRVDPVLASAEAVNVALQRYYPMLAYDEVFAEFDADEIEVPDAAQRNAETDQARASIPIVLARDDVVETLADAQVFGVSLDESPLCKLTHLILVDAVKRRATRVVMEHDATRCTVHYTIDGAERAMMRPPVRLGNALVNRLQIMAGVNPFARTGKAGSFTHDLGRERFMTYRTIFAPAPAGMQAVIDVGPNQQRAMPDAALIADEPRHTSIERAIAEAPDDIDGYRVYADWLTERGDPRGVLMCLLRSDEAAAAEYFEEHTERFVGPFAGRDDLLHASWRHGFMEHAVLRVPWFVDEDEWPRLVQTFFELGSTRLLRKLTIDPPPEPRNLEPMLHAIVAHAPLTMTGLQVGDGHRGALRYCDTGPLAALNDLSQLRELGLCMRTIRLDGLCRDRIESLELASADLDRRVVDQLVADPWPRLTRLEIDHTTVELRRDAPGLSRAVAASIHRDFVSAR